MAAALLGAHLAERGLGAHIHSAGLLSDGRPATEHGLAVMAARGLDTSAHRSRRLDTVLVKGADLIVGMSRRHVREAVALDADAWPRTFTLKEIVRRGEAYTPLRPEQLLSHWLAALHAGRRLSDLIGDSAEDDVADPIGKPKRAYERVVSELDDLTTRLARLLAG
jgi:protein-tyrosine phosphatase